MRPRCPAVGMASDVSRAALDLRSPFHFHFSLLILLFLRHATRCSRCSAVVLVIGVGRRKCATWGAAAAAAAAARCAEHGRCGCPPPSSLHESTLTDGTREHTLLKFVCEQPNDVSSEHSENCTVETGTTIK